MIILEVSTYKISENKSDLLIDGVFHLLNKDIQNQIINRLNEIKKVKIKGIE